jgi:hypothetical protein
MNPCKGCILNRRAMGNNKNKRNATPKETNAVTINCKGI